MTDKKWYQEVKLAWLDAAARLVKNGWEERDHPQQIIPATFHKVVDGKERVLILTRERRSKT